VPDVAADASKSTGLTITTYTGDLGSGNGNQDIGGTSLSAPLWAGVAALYDNYSASRKSKPLGDAASVLYKMAALADRPLFDITTVQPDCNGCDLAGPVGPGWDRATGLGSPNAAVIVHDGVAVSSPAISYTDLHGIDWASVTLPAGTCGAKEAFQLQGSQAIITTNRFPGFAQVRVYAIIHDSDTGAPSGYFSGLAFGDLEHSGHDDAALSVSCETGGGTGSSILADDLVVYSGAGGVHALGVLHTNASLTFNAAPYFEQVSLSDQTVTALEDYYSSNDPTAAPSGRQTDKWSWDGRVFRLVSSTRSTASTSTTTTTGSGDPASPLTFATPAAIGVFLAAHGIACDGYHDYSPSAVEDGADAQGACTSSGNDVELLTFSDAAHRDTWTRGLRSTASAGCASGATGQDVTTTFVLGANWASYVNGVVDAPSQALTAQIANVAGTQPAQVCR
jgi:hypothetical protein